MKINHGLVIILMVIISLLAMSMVCASENVSDVVEVDDINEVVSIEDNLDDNVAIEDACENVASVENNNVTSEILSIESEKESNISVNDEDNEIIKNALSNYNFNFTSLFGKNSTDDLFVVDLSGIIDKNNIKVVSLVFDTKNYGNNTYGNSYLILDLPSLLGKNNTNDASYLVLGVSSLFGGNKTNDHSYFIQDLPNYPLFNNYTLIIDLNNLLKENGTFEGSFLYMREEGNNISLDEFFQDLDINLTETVRGNFTSLSNFLEDNYILPQLLGENNTLVLTLQNLNWTALFNGNITALKISLNNMTDFFGYNISDVNSLKDINLTTAFKTLNWTAIKGNFTTLRDSLNITNIFGYNVSDIASIFDFNLTSLLNKWNLSGIGFNVSDFASLFKFNITSLLSKVNLTSLLNKMNLTSLLNFNLTSLLNKVNLTSLLSKVNLTSLLNLNLTSLLSKVNLTSLLNKVNLTSFLNKFNWTSLFGGNSTDKDSNNNSGNNTNFLDILFENNTVNSFIRDLLNVFTGENKNNNTISSDIDNSVYSSAAADDYILSNNLNTYYSKLTSFEVIVMSGDETVPQGSVVFRINNKEYYRKINSNGVAVLDLKLKPGIYTVTSTFGDVSVTNSIVVKKSIFTKNVSKKYKKVGKFNVKVLNRYGKVHAKQIVKIKLNGKIYTAKTNKKGIATFKLSKKLKVGKYTIKTLCKGLTISNKLTVKK